MTEASAASRAADDARGISVNFLTLLAQAAFPAFHVQLARRLGDGAYGAYMWCEYIVDLGSLVTLFGMDQAVQRQVAMLPVDAPPEASARIVGTALRTVVLSGIAVGAVIWVCAPWIARDHTQAGMLTALRALALKPLFYHMTGIFIVATQARGRMQYDFWTRGLAQPLTLLAATTAALSLGTGLAGAAVAVTLSIACTTLLAARLFARDLSLRLTLSAAWSGAADRDTVRTALPLVLASAAWAVQGRIEPLLLKHWKGDTAVAAFAASLLYVSSISQVRSIFAPVVLRRIPAALRDGRRDELMATLALQTRWTALLAAPLAVLFGGFAEPLLSVFGRRFALGAEAMGVLAIAHFVNACALANFVIPMSGRGHYSTVAAALACVFQLALLPVLIPRYGLTGAAMGAAAGLVFSQVVQGIFSWHIARVHGLSWSFARVIIAALLALAAGRVTHSFVDLSELPRFVVGVGVAALTYAVAVLALGIEPEERAMLRALYAKLRR